jgi:hypothetical protein
MQISRRIRPLLIGDTHDIIVMEFYMKPVVSPTSRQKIEGKKTCDIIRPSSQGRGCTFCYLFQELQPLIFFRYTDRILKSW